MQCAFYYNRFDDSAKEKICHQFLIVFCGFLCVASTDTHALHSQKNVELKTFQIVNIINNQRERNIWYRSHQHHQLKRKFDSKKYITIGRQSNFRILWENIV